jgi:hypothetical protein
VQEPNAGGIRADASEIRIARKVRVLTAGARARIVHAARYGQGKAANEFRSGSDVGQADVTFVF